MYGVLSEAICGMIKVIEVTNLYIKCIHPIFIVYICTYEHHISTIKRYITQLGVYSFIGILCAYVHKFSNKDRVIEC